MTGPIIACAICLVFGAFVGALVMKAASHKVKEPTPEPDMDVFMKNKLGVILYTIQNCTIEDVNAVIEEIKKDEKL